MAALNEEQTMIRDQAKSWVSEKAPVSNFRKLRDSDDQTRFAAETWSQMIEMGWTGMIIPEQYGGSDLGLLTFGIVLEETGRQLTASPLVASALVGASAVILGGSDEQKQSLLPKVIDGSQVLTLAVDEGPRHNPVNIEMNAKSSGKGYTLNGDKTFVLEGQAATTLIVAARTSGTTGNEAGVSLFVVPTDTKGVLVSQLHTVDSRGYANISFDNVTVGEDALLGKLDEGFEILTATLDRARAGIASEMLGTASQAFDMTLDYLKTRVQFGSVIGSFQALGHRAAGLFSEMELARSCVEAAHQTIDAEGDAGKIKKRCSLAKCRAGEFIHHMSNELIQIHGGIGMTDEFDAGLYLKRARPLETLYGNQAFHRDRYAKLHNF